MSVEKKSTPVSSYPNVNTVGSENQKNNYDNKPLSPIGEPLEEKSVPRLSAFNNNQDADKLKSTTQNSHYQRPKQGSTSRFPNTNVKRTPSPKASSFAEYEAKQQQSGRTVSGIPHHVTDTISTTNANNNGVPAPAPAAAAQSQSQSQSQSRPANTGTGANHPRRNNTNNPRSPRPQAPRTNSPFSNPKQRASFAAKGQNPNQNLISPAPASSTGVPSSQRQQNTTTKRTPLKIIPLGGLGEIGKNLTVYEYGNDMFIVDCGLAFPDSDMLGVDIVIPDFTYLEKNADKFRGVIITHGHEDHIGGLAYLLKKINVPIYATRLTIGLIEGKLREHGLLNKVSLNVVLPRQTVKLGCMAAEFIRVNHSIPDAVSFAIHTPVGVLIHTGDFKVDYTPIEGDIIDLARFGELGNKGVLALLADSTNSERSGYTASERTVGLSLDRLFEQAEGKRIIIATFSSNVHRVQQIINCAVKSKRKVAIFGRSMINVMSIGIELGCLKVPDGLIIDIDLMSKYPFEDIVLITTGSQGEPMSALTRMAMSEHKKVSITPHDFIIISANPIPGNEKYVTRVVNELMKAGAEVIHEDVHVSGHACQEEQKLILALTRPKYFIPVHGEYKHLKKHASTAMAVGIPEDRIVIAENGAVIETNGMEMKLSGHVQSGRIMVDGLGVGDVGSIVLRDRKHLAEDGLIIVVATIEGESGTVLAGPDIVSRGFVYVRESEELMTHAKRILSETLCNCLANDTREWTAIKTKIKDALSDYIYVKTKRSPMILPVIMEI